jgi:hypothetical protein
MHTTRSDGLRTPDEAAALYEESGYDFINITDHWVCREERRRPNMLVLSGIEIDYALETQCVHLIGVGVDPESLNLGERERADVKRAFREQSLQHGIDTLRAVGGCVALSHPAWSLNTLDVVRSLNGLFAMEIFNSVSRPPWNAERSDASALADVCAANGLLMPLIAVDDSHFYAGEQCAGFVRVQAEALARESIVDALQSGAFYASQGPTIEQVEWDDRRMIVHTSPAERAIFCTSAYYNPNRVAIRPGGVEWVYERRSELGETFVRCEITDAGGRKAWTSPVRWPT